jgi:hypothetical protein
MKKAFTLLTGMALASLVMASPVSAETKKVCTTSYGGATECHEETTNETVTHEVQGVNTGIVENVAAGAAIFAIGYLLMLKANQLTK